MKTFRLLHILSGNFKTINVDRNISLADFKLEFEIVMINHLLTPLEDGDNDVDSEYKKRQLCIRLIEEARNIENYIVDWFDQVCSFIMQEVLHVSTKKIFWENLMLSEFEIVEIV